MINHLHILDMFTSEGFEPTPQVVVQFLGFCRTCGRASFNAISPSADLK
jgi:hypothetical protein